ncbi:hypothetical protein HY632_00750 [Candidatus Uhrbacteria bacterium]|nr:hypothetical protein [Candidatus Uhrbacteria bacterium]
MRVGSLWIVLGGMVMIASPVAAAPTDLVVTVELDPLITGIDAAIPRGATRDAIQARCPTVVLGAPDDDRGIFFSERPMLVVRIRPAPVLRSLPNSRAVLVQVGFTRGAGTEPTWTTVQSSGTSDALAADVRSSVTRAIASYVCPEHVLPPQTLPPVEPTVRTATRTRPRRAADAALVLPPHIPTSTPAGTGGVWRTPMRVVGYSLLAASAVGFGIGVWQGTEVTTAGDAFTRAMNQPEVIDAQTRGIAASDRANALFLASGVAVAVGGLAILLEVIGVFDDEESPTDDLAPGMPRTSGLVSRSGGEPWSAH